MKDKIIEKVDGAIKLLESIRIDIALKPKREGIDDQASDLNLLLCEIHDSIDSLYSGGVSEKEFTNTCMDIIHIEVKKFVAEPSSVSVAGRIFEKLIPVIQFHPILEISEGAKLIKSIRLTANSIDETASVFLDLFDGSEIEFIKANGESIDHWKTLKELNNE